jgi:4-hydroxybenzoate polyprenyltransferase
MARDSLFLAGFAFLAFCAAASAGYLINDLRDRKLDRLHPTKKHRPIAAGALGPGVALFAAAALAVMALIAAFRLGALFTMLLSAYLVLSALYSAIFKDVVILDVMTISVLFLIRVQAGAAAIQVEVSSWLLLCTVFLALFLAFSKRRHEISLLADDAAAQRQVLTHYSGPFLDQMINVVTASAVVAYSIYAASPETAARHDGRQMVFTVPFVLFGIFRYLYLIYQRPGKRTPTEELLTDGPFVVNLFLWVLAVLCVLYQ